LTSSPPASEPATARFANRIAEASKPTEIASSSADGSAPRRAATPEERQAVLANPAVRRIFDALDARLVELKIPNPASDETE
jgi:hypothetical protein